MTFGYAALAFCAVLAAGGVFLFVRRGVSSDDPDLGSVSTSWLDEHKSGRQ
ncbi:MAG TPA: hypothetical protein VGZ27_05440 [Vicinamibacterales bacterium]|jgi:hypothetical protein|nr:hypothetical protein [Vicinamibacterales bacterium]